MERTTVLWVLVGIIGFLGFLAFIYAMIFVGGIFDAAREDQRTKVFEQSKSYKQGMRSELNRLYLEYQKADTAGRIGIANVVRDQYAPVDTADYKPHLQQFLAQIGAK